MKYEKYIKYAGILTDKSRADDELKKICFNRESIEGSKSEETLGQGNIPSPRS